mgnify:CR=1 FL=1
MSAAAWPDYLEPFDGFCRIRIEGVEFEVPRGNTVLRVLQHLEQTSAGFELVYKDFCWNADCHNCKFAYTHGGEVREALGCRHLVTEGLDIVRLPRSVFRGSALAPTPAPESAV